MTRVRGNNYIDLTDYVVNWMVSEGIAKTYTGNYMIYGSEIAEFLRKTLGLSLHSGFEWLDRHKRAIRDRLDAREEIIGDTWFIHNECNHMSREDKEKLKDVVGFDMVFGLAYCPQAEEGIYDI